MGPQTHCQYLPVLMSLLTGLGPDDTLECIYVTTCHHSQLLERHVASMRWFSTYFENHYSPLVTIVMNRDLMRSYAIKAWFAMFNIIKHCWSLSTGSMVQWFNQQSRWMVVTPKPWYTEKKRGATVQHRNFMCLITLDWLMGQLTLKITVFVTSWKPTAAVSSPSTKHFAGNRKHILQMLLSMQQSFHLHDNTTSPSVK